MELLPDPDELSDRLRQYDAGIEAILKEKLGPRWRFAKPEDEQAALTPRQMRWQSLRMFYEASIVNAGDLFAYLGIVYDNPEMFAEIGAVKTLAAAEALRGMRAHYDQLATPEEQRAYLKETAEKRDPIEEEAEDMDEFAALLIAWAEAHPEDFPVAEAVDPMVNMMNVFADMRREAEARGPMDATTEALLAQGERRAKELQAMMEELKKGKGD